MRRQHGFTLVELLIAMTLMLIIFGATLTTFERSTVLNQTNQDQNEQQAKVRNVIDRMAREMRNHAAPAPDQQVGIDKADPYDLVFQTVDSVKPAGSNNSRNVSRVRYCLDTSVPENEKIFLQTQTWTTAATPPVPTTIICPAPEWGAARVIADHIVNAYGGQQRAAWIANSSQISHISAIRTRLFVDLDPTRLPHEQSLDTTISLRNENQAPVAAFTYSVNANGSVVLNATGSYDPEGQRISYEWDDGSTPVGSDLAFTWDNPALGQHTVTLIVTDGSGLSESTSQTVQIP
jgi:prepilin-type N-terminal cleavage/methylation domain-containing protein